MSKKLIFLFLIYGSCLFVSKTYAQCDPVLSYSQNWSGLPTCWSFPNGNANIGSNGFGGQSGGAFIRSRELINLQGTYTISTRTTTNTNSGFTLQLIQNGAVVQSTGVSVSPGNFRSQTFQFNVAGSGYIQIAQLTTNAPFIALGNMTFTGTCPSGTGVDVFTKDITVQLNANGTVNVNPQDIDDGSGDICGNVVTLSIDKSTFTCADLGENSVSFTATRADGESANAIATVTVEPATALSTFNIYLDESGDANYTVEEFLGSSTTNCSEIIYSIDKLAFTCSDLGNNQEVIVTASYGTTTNLDTHLVNVRDTISPKNIVTNNISITLSEVTGMVSIIPEDLFVSATDNCSTTFTLSLSQTDFVCGDAGQNTVSLTVTDESGNVTSKDVIVTVLSTISEQLITTTSSSFCTDGSASSATIDMASSELEVNYYLRNSITNAILDGPVAGTGGALSFNTGSLTETTTVYIFAESAPAANSDSALDFDGSNDRVETTYTQSATTELTIEGWIYPRSTSRSLIISNYDGSALSGGDMFFDTQNTFPYNGRGLRMSIVGSNNDRLTLMVDDVLELNSWNHIAHVFDNGVAKIYLDGVEIGTSTATFTSIPAASNPFYLAQHSTTNGTILFNGKMDELRIWNTAKTASELATNMNTKFVGTETGLSAYFNFDEGSGSSLTDLVNGANGTLINMDVAADWVNGVTYVENNVCDVRLATEITIGDSTPPTAISQDVSAQLGATGNITLLAADFNNGSTDNCTVAGDLQFSLDQVNFDCTMLGTNTVTLTVADEYGNNSTATATVTIQDTTAPTAPAVLPALSKPLDATGSLTAAALDFSNGFSDNCTANESLIFSLSQTVFDCSHIGLNTLTLTVTDLSGNSSNAPVTLNIIESAPKVITQDITVALDATGNVSIAPEDIDNGSSDDCSDDEDLVFSLNETNFSCRSIGSNVIVLTVTDLNGNSNTNTATVTVVDLMAPVVVTKDITVILGTNGTASITPANIDNGSTDNCTAVGDLTFNLNITSFDIDDLGTNTVTLSVTDASGNVGTETATITVSDKQAQTITFDAIADMIFGDTSFDLVASTDSNLPIVFSVLNGGVTISGNTATITNAGSVTIRASQAGDGTFAPSEVDRTFNIAKADQTLTIDEISNQSQTVSAVIVSAAVDTGFDLEYAVTGPATIAGNVLTLDGTLGTVEVTVNQAGNDNYNFVSGTTTFEVVAKQAQIITFATISDLTYGVADQTLTATSSSDLAVSLSVVSGPASLNNNVLSITGTGMVTIEATQLGDDDFLAAIPVQNTFSVNKAPLTITADNKSIVFGEAIPDLTITYSAFVNGEDQSIMTTLPGITTTATATSNVGDYDIALSGGVADNYAITLTNGTLTIEKATVEIVITELTQTVDETPKSPTVTTNPAGLNFNITYSGDANAPSMVGSYQVIVTIDEQNYTGSKEVTFIINAVLSAGDEADIQIRVYPNPTTDFLNIDSENNNESKINIINMNGVSMININLRQGEKQINVSTLSPGIYLVVIQDKDLTIIKRQTIMISK